LNKGGGNLINIDAHIDAERQEGKCRSIECVSTTFFDLGSRGFAEVGEAIDG